METLTMPSLASRIPTETAAWKYLEKRRWKGHPVCPHCGVIDGHYLLKPRNRTRTTSTGAKTYRRLWKCHACRRQFSVLVGTIFHGSKVPIRTWLFVLMEMCASKNGIAGREVQRKYGLTAKTAWYLCHRIREAMVDRNAETLFGTVVADETWVGGKGTRVPHYVPAMERFKWAADHRMENKTPVLSIYDRTSDKVRSRVVPNVRAATLASELRKNVDTFRSILHTDESRSYTLVGREFLAHEFVNHSDGEYVRGEVTTNDLENFFGQLKRSIDGTFHHVSREHLDRYLAEFDFRYSTHQRSDSDRLELLFSQTQGRRLRYRELIEARVRATPTSGRSHPAGRPGGAR
jgi:transposase-like protein